MIRSAFSYVKFSILIFPFIITACSYQFNEDYFKEVQEPIDGSVFSIDDVSDTLKIWKKVNLSYNFKSENQVLYSLVVYINGEELLNSTDTLGYIVFDPNELGDGNHNVEIELIYSSGSRSMADLAGGEGFISTYKFVLSIDTSPPTSFSIRNVWIEDGSIYISWNPINKEFSKLSLLSQGDFEREFNLTYYNDTVFRDSLSTFLWCDYVLKVDGYNYSKLSNKKGYRIEKPIFSTSYYDPENCLLTWEKHPLYNNVLTYEIYDNLNISLDVMGGQKPIAITPVFAEHIGKQVHFVGHSFFNGFMWGEFRLGTLFSNLPSYTFLYLSETNSYYTFRFLENELYLTQLEADQLTEVKTIKMPNATKNGLRLHKDYESVDIIVSTSSKLFRVDSDLNNVSLICNTVDYTTDYVIYATYLNKYISLMDKDKNELYNANTKELIFTKPQKNNHNIILSDDATMFFCNDSIYRLDGNNVSFHAAIDNDGNRIRDCYFDIENNLLYYIVYDRFGNQNNPVKYNLTTGAKSFLPITGRFQELSYDAATNSLAFISYGGIAIYHINSNMSKSIAVYEAHKGYTHHYLNGKLITTQGYYMDF